VLVVRGELPEQTHPAAERLVKGRALAGASERSERFEDLLESACLMTNG